MSTARNLILNVSKLDPKEAAKRIVETKELRGAWLDEFTEHLDKRRAGKSLTRTLEVWDLSQSEAARLFGVSRQALNKWLVQGAPAERADAIADLSAATDLLVRHLKRDRISAVVRRPIPAMDERTMLELIGSGETRQLLMLCREMFSFGSVQSH
jgi:predicted transcriptional regulator